MGGGLVGHDVDRDAAAHELGQHLGGVAEQPDRERPRPRVARRPAAARARRRGRRRARRGSPVCDPALDALQVDLDAQRRAVAHRDRQRLRAAHPAEAGGHDQPAGERAAEALAGDRRERLVGALEDPLGPDVDPGPGGHLAVHHQPGRVELAEVLPRWPSRGTRFELAISTRGASSCVSNTATGLPDWTSSVSSSPRRMQLAADRAVAAPGRARPCRSRRRRSAPRASRRRRGAGCSRASAAPPPAASRGSAARFGRAHGVLSPAGWSGEPRGGSRPAAPSPAPASSSAARSSAGGRSSTSGATRCAHRRVQRADEPAGRARVAVERLAGAQQLVRATTRSSRRTGVQRHQRARSSPSRRGPPGCRRSGWCRADGMGERAQLGDERGRARTGRSCSRSTRPAGGRQERRQRARSSTATRAGRSAARRSSRGRRARAAACRSASASAWPWKLPAEMTSGGSSNTSGLSVDRVEVDARRAGRRTRTPPARRRGPAPRSAASRRPAAGAAPRVVHAVRAGQRRPGSFAALRTWPARSAQRVDARRRRRAWRRAARRSSSAATTSTVSSSGPTRTDGQRADRRHEVRAVDEREALLGLEARAARGRSARAPPRRRPPRPSGSCTVALADQRQEGVRRRREVAARAERAGARDDAARSPRSAAPATRSSSDGPDAGVRRQQPVEADRERGADDLVAAAARRSRRRGCAAG